MHQEEESLESIKRHVFRGAARNTFYLKRLGVTHVLNTAEGNRNGTVNTNQVSFQFAYR